MTLESTATKNHKEILDQTIKLQQLASNPNNSAWVFASAGSGKTKILVDRVLRLLLDGVNPNKILCLTFTKIAASEMQNRINSELSNWVLLDDSKLIEKLSQLSGNYPNNNDLKKARTLFVKILDDESKIKIQTIHSFCQNLVKIFPFEAQIKPNFEVIEKSQEQLLLQKSQKEILKRAISNESLKNLVIKINATLHEETFSELISELLSKKEQLTILKENFFGIEGVIAEIFKNFSVSINEENYLNKIFDNFLQKIDSNKILNLADKLENTGLVNNTKIAIAIKKFTHNPIIENFSIYQEAFFTQENKPRKVSKEISQELELSSLIASQQEIIIDFSDQLNSYNICNSSALLLRFVDQILEIYSDLKNQNSFLDYNDLIIKTNQLLNNPNFSEWIKLKMDGFFDHILIDESQDTNHQQWNIIKALCEDFFSGIGASNKNRTIFIVGDEKQSIYSFQGAEPNISQEIYSYFVEKLKDHPIKFYKIDLNNSFRSLSSVLEIIDATFSGKKESAAITKITEFRGHQAIRSGIGRAEIWPKIKKKPLDSPNNLYQWKIDFSHDFSLEENYNETDFLAEKIVLKIKDWVENKRILEGRIEPLNYSDFMILLRNRTNNFDKILTKFFHKHNVPIVSSSSIKFCDNLIIQDLLSAAKFALFDYDDLNLACLLKSPIFAINEEELLEICLIKNSDGINIYQALQQIQKFTAIKNQLDEIKAKSLELNVFEFFYFLLDEKENREKIIARFGKNSANIIDKFLLKTFDFCKNFSPNLNKFLDFIEKLDLEISPSMQRNNEVLITTIHATKGLQSPVVFIPDCCFITNQLPSTREKISWIKFDQNTLPVWCAKKNEENKLLKTHREQKKQLAKDEYLRLLYVAMTRAEDEIYIAGFGNADNEESWYQIIKNSFIDKAQELKTWQLDFSVTDDLREKFEIENNVLGLGNKEYKYLENLQNIAKIDDVDSIKFLAKKALTIKKDITISSQIDQGQIKGRLIHKILEIIGKNHQIDQNWLLDLSKKIIVKEDFLNPSEQEEIYFQISNFLNSQTFKNLFSLGEIKCEVPIAGNLDNQAINARIDLLIIKENEVLIIDYKSDEFLPKEIPIEYLSQLNLYKMLIKNIYPDKKITCGIFWLKFLQIHWL